MRLLFVRRGCFGFDFICSAIDNSNRREREAVDAFFGFFFFTEEEVGSESSEEDFLRFVPVLVVAAVVDDDDEEDDFLLDLDGGGGDRDLDFFDRDFVEEEDFLFDREDEDLSLFVSSSTCEFLFFFVVDFLFELFVVVGAGDELLAFFFGVAKLLFSPLDAAAAAAAAAASASAAAMVRFFGSSFNRSDAAFASFSAC